MAINDPEISDHVLVIMETAGIFIPLLLRAILLDCVPVFLHPRLWLHREQLVN